MIRSFCLPVVVMVVFLVGYTAAQEGVSTAPTYLDLLTKSEELQKANQFDSALVLAKQALEIAERTYGPEDTSVARALDRMTRTAYYSGDFAEAEKFGLRELEIYEKVLGGDSYRVGACLRGLSAVISKQARYDEAADYGRRALIVLEKSLGHDHQEIAHAVRSLGLHREDQGRFSEADSLYREALTIYEQALGPEHIDVARVLNDLAILNKLEGHLGEAEDLALRSLRIKEKLLGPETQPVSVSLNVLGTIYSEQLRYSDAEKVMRRSLEIREHLFGPDHIEIQSPLLNLGGVLKNQSRFDEAETILRRALAIAEKFLGPDHPEVATALDHLAITYAMQDRFAEAEPLARRAVSIREMVLGPEHWSTAFSAYLQGAISFRQGRYAEAATHWQRARAIFVKAGGANDYRAAMCLSDLAMCRLRQANYAASIEAATQAFEVRKQNFRDLAQTMSERNALEYSGYLSHGAANLLTALDEARMKVPGSDDAAAKAVLSVKGQVSDGILSRHTSVREMSDLMDSLNAARVELGTLYVRGPDDKDPTAYQLKLNDVTRRKERFEAELARTSSDFRREQEMWDLDAGKIAKALPEGASLVEYMRYEHRINYNDFQPRYLAVAVRSDGLSYVFPLGSAAAIDTAVAHYRRQFENPRTLDKPAYADAAEELYALVWKPMATALDGASTVFVAPDGDLNLVSCAGLIDDNGHYLIENYPIQYLSTGRDLIRLQDRKRSGEGLLAIGDPDFDESPTSTMSAIGKMVLISLTLRSNCEELNKLQVARLPATREEVSAVASQWSEHRREPAVTYFGKDATEEQFKQAAPKKRVIHLATHGFYLSDKCKPKTRGGDLMERGYVGENPFLQCGFLLAGANRRGDGAREAKTEDGIVTAEEVAGLNLRGTDLVVLSACETGLGTVRSGEGVYGLRRAFQMAGARTVVSALWQVDDKATAALMGTLFSATGTSVPHAMQKAALNRIQSARVKGESDHPFYWAAFVATGDWQLATR